MDKNLFDRFLSEKEQISPGENESLCNRTLMLDVLLPKGFSRPVLASLEALNVKF